MARILNRTSSDKDLIDYLIYLVVVVGGILLSVKSASLYLTFDSGIDLAIFSQALWNSLHGRWLVTSLEVNVVNHLGFHMSPILFLLVPLYALLPSPVTLLVIQGMALAAGGLPLYWLAHRRWQGRPAAFFLVICYLANLAVTQAAEDEFHPIALTVPLLLFSFHYLVDRRFRLAWVFLTLAVACNETVSLVTTALGLYVALAMRERKLGIAIAVVSLLWFVFAVSVLMPPLSTANAYVPAGGGYAYLGQTLPEILINGFLQPTKVLRVTVSKEKLVYLAALLLPVGLLPLLAPEVLLIAAPILLQNLISTYELHYYVFRHHVSLIVPFLFAATVVGGQRLPRLTRIMPTQTWLQTVLLSADKFLCGVLAVGLVLNLAIGVYLHDLDFLPFRFRFATERAQVGTETHARIPALASVAAPHDHLGPLAHREELYPLSRACLSGPPHASSNPYAGERVWPDFILVDVNASHTFLTPEQMMQCLETLRQDPMYRVVESRVGITLLRRQSAGPIGRFSQRCHIEQSR